MFTVSNKPFDNNQRDSVLRLLRAIPIDDFKRVAHMVSLAQCLENGFIVVTEAGNPVREIPRDMFNKINRLYGHNNEAANATFHKSFETVERMDPYTYYTQQLIHYFGTYGYEMMGLKPVSFVPVEKLEIPGVKFNSKNLQVIYALEPAAIYGRFYEWLESTKAPQNWQTVCATVLMDNVRVNPPEEIASNELRVIYFRMHHVVPSDPTEFLRYVIYELTGSTLLIKSRSVIADLKRYSYFKEVKNYFNAYNNEAKLATIFFRYKPIFLALKKANGMGPVINRIRRLADEYHKPLGDVNVRNLGNLIRAGRTEDVQKVIDKASNRELVKLANYLGKYLSLDGDPVGAVYNIRNGAAWVESDVHMSAIKGKHEEFMTVLIEVCEALAERIRDTIKGRAFLVDEDILLALPTSEKQFTGNIPWGTIVNLDGCQRSRLIAGIHWKDSENKDQRTDLDLHVNSATQHYGWNSRYTGECTYSGDMTAAPEPFGAAEAFKIDHNNGEDYIVSVNKFCGCDAPKFKLFFSESDNPRFDERNYIYDANEAIVPPINVEMAPGERALTLGLVANGAFYFYGGNLTSGLVPSGNYEEYIKAIKGRLMTCWSVVELLDQCGARIYTDIDEVPEDQVENMVDLRAAQVEQKTLFDLIDGNL